MKHINIISFIILISQPVVPNLFKQRSVFFKLKKEKIPWILTIKHLIRLALSKMLGVQPQNRLGFAFPGAGIPVTGSLVYFL